MPNGRCRMHGGKCRGPSTPQGKARMTAANTKHGNFCAHARAEQHHVRAAINRTWLICTARLLWRYLPPDMAARLAEGPAELSAPIHPSNLPYVTPQHATRYNVKTRPKPTTPTRTSARPHKPTPKPTARAAERQAAQAEAAAQAPWRAAIALARAAKRIIRQARTAWRQNQTPRRNALQREPTTTTTPPSPLVGLGREERTKGWGEGSRPNAPPPLAAWDDLTPLQQELAARQAGLRGPRCGQSQNDAARAPQAGPTRLCTKSPGRHAMHREPTAQPGGARPPTALPSAPSAPTRPASPRPPAPAEAHPSRPPLAGHQTKPAGRHAIHREHPTPPALARLTPTKAKALRTTTLAETWNPAAVSQLAARFGHPLPAPGLRIPQALPTTDPIANAVHSFTAKTQCAAT